MLDTYRNITLIITRRNWKRNELLKNLYIGINRAVVEIELPLPSWYSDKNLYIFHVAYKKIFSLNWNKVGEKYLKIIYLFDVW